MIEWGTTDTNIDPAPFFADPTGFTIVVSWCKETLHAGVGLAPVRLPEIVATAVVCPEPFGHFVAHCFCWGTQGLAMN
jgi:hypothetical protein